MSCHNQFANNVSNKVTSNVTTTVDFGNPTSHFPDTPEQNIHVPDIIVTSPNKNPAAFASMDSIILPRVNKAHEVVIPQEGHGISNII